MRPIVRVLTGLLAWSATSAAVAWACTCEPVTAEDVVESGDAIVVATITRVRDLRAGCLSRSSTDPFDVTIDVEEVVAGPGQLGADTVRTSADGAACGLAVGVGERWVLQIPDAGGLSLCSGSRRLFGDDDPWLAELRAAAE